VSIKTLLSLRLECISEELLLPVCLPHHEGMETLQNNRVLGNILKYVTTSHKGVVLKVVILA
jgi:hypothetical protein